MSRITVFALAGAVALAGCDDPADPAPGGGDEGVMLTWVGGSRYEASGAPGFDNGDVIPATFATAFADSVGGLVIGAFQQKQGTRGDLFILQLTVSQTGEFGPCHVSADCHGRLLEDIDAANTLDVAAHWELIGGSVTVQTIGSRIVAEVDELVFEDSASPGSTRTIDGGTIDLPFLTGDEAVTMMRCFLVSATGGTCA